VPLGVDEDAITPTAPSSEALGRGRQDPPDTRPLLERAGHVLSDADALLEAALARGRVVESAEEPRDRRLLGRFEK
jgi:hypothetical protein